MIQSVEARFGLVNRLPAPVEWLSDNGSPYTARETRALAKLPGPPSEERHEIGLRTWPEV
jgi:putative transposase